MATALITHGSAIKYWRTERPYELGILAQGPADAMLSGSHLAHERDILEVCGDGYRSESGTLHVCVGRNDRYRSRRSSDAVVYHIRNLPFPEGSFFLDKAGVLVASPELCFLQAARFLPLPHLVLYGMELCGEYSLSDANPRGFFRHETITSPEAIARYLARCPGDKGLRNARNAQRFLNGPAYSPAEAKIETALAVSTRQDGFGIKRHLMNTSITLPPDAQRILGSEHIRPDFLWPDEKVALEYDSMSDHSSPRALNRDALRRRAYNVSGYYEIPATPASIDTYEHFSTLVRELRSALGLPNRRCSIELEERRRAFFELVFHTPMNID